MTRRARRTLLYGLVALLGLLWLMMAVRSVRRGSAAADCLRDHPEYLL